MRALMGIAVMCIVIPAMALVMPEQFERLTSWGDDPEVVFDDPQAVAAARDRRGSISDRSVSSSPNSRGQATAEAARNKKKQGGSDPEASTTTAHTDHETTTTGGSATTEDTGNATTSTSGATSTTSGSVQVDGTISGDACPCEVNGTVELKGTVNLKGDIMVMGGTLVARSGVTVNGNGYQIMFMNGGRADFQGTPTSTWSNRGATQNLTRDITFRNVKRIMFHKGAGKSTLRFMTVVDSGGPKLGEYPIHFHLNGNSSSGTLIEGVVVLNGKNHAIVPHGSHGITIKDVIAKNTYKEAIWWDPPGTNESCSFQKFCTVDNSNNVILDHVLVDGAYVNHGDDGYHSLDGFHLGAGSGNVVKNSAAINIRGGANCSGFQWPSSANQNAGGNVWIFRNNYSKSDDCHGIFVWQNDGNNHVIDGFTGSGIEHGAYSNRYHYTNFSVPYFEVHASGVTLSNGTIGTVIADRHRNASDATATFTNVKIDRFIIDNAGFEAGRYILNGTGLSCGDIEYQDVQPGTEVVIDGSTC